MLDCVFPCFGVVVKRNANDLEAFRVILLVVRHHIRHLLAARAAPARPEVNQHIIALAAPFAQSAGLSLSVVHRQVGEHHAGSAFFKSRKIRLHTRHCRMVVVRSGLRHELFQLVIIVCRVYLAEIYGRYEVVFVLLNNLQLAVHKVVVCGFIIRLQLFQLCLSRLSGIAGGNHVVSPRPHVRISQCRNLIVVAIKFLVQLRPVKCLCYRIDVDRCAVIEHREIIIAYANQHNGVFLAHAVKHELSSSYGHTVKRDAFSHDAHIHHFHIRGHSTRNLVCRLLRTKRQQTEREGGNSQNLFHCHFDYS